MSDEELVPITVRVPRSQIDALDEMDEQGEIPNRSEGIRSMIGFSLDSDEFEVPDEASTLEKFQRTKRLSKVHFYREGFRQQVRTVLGGVAGTSPPWTPEQVERTAPQIFERQIETLFDSDDRRAEAWDALEAETDLYRAAYNGEADEDNPYLEAFQEDDDESEWTPEWKPDVGELLPDARDLLADPQNDPETVETALSARKNVDADLASTVVSRALSECDESRNGGVSADD